MGYTGGVSVYIPDCNIKKIAESGQCFRMNPIGEDMYSVFSKNKGAKVKQLLQSGIELWCNNADADYWFNYFSELDYSEVEGYLMHTMSNPFALESIMYCSGLFLLNQDPWETLISFIISQRKSIPAIKSCIEAFCCQCGEEIESGYAFPTAEEVVHSADKLSKVPFGYREDYVLGAAKAVVEGRLDLDKISKLSYNKAKFELMKLRGVGPKVADCTLLYGLGFNNAFPIDTWVSRIINEDFNGSMQEIEKCEKYKGILQLYMFYYKRCKGKD